MSWKQPVDTGILEWFENDYLCRDLFLLLFLRARNADMTVPEYYQRKPYLLKKGQVIFGRNKYAKELRCSPSCTDRALKRLQIVTCKVTCIRSKDYTVVTILDYDSLIKMNKQKSKKRTSSEQAVNTNKSVESVESEKIGDYNYENFIESFNRITGKKFRGDKKSRSQFSARIFEMKATREDFEHVILEAYKKLNSPEYVDYLTPELVTRSDKFQRYVNSNLKGKKSLQEPNPPSPLSATELIAERDNKILENPGAENIITQQYEEIIKQISQK